MTIRRDIDNMDGPYPRTDSNELNTLDPVNMLESTMALDSSSVSVDSVLYYCNLSRIFFTTPFLRFTMPVLVCLRGGRSLNSMGLLCRYL